MYIDLIGKRNWYFGASAILIIAGLATLIIFGLPLSIDFTGGSKLEFQLPTASNLSTSGVNGVLLSQGIDSSIVQLSDENVVIIRTRELDEESQTALRSALGERFGSEVVVLRAESVGPSVSTEVGWRALQAVAIASIGIVIYIWFAFRGVPNAERYGVTALLAMLHDVLVVLSFAAIVGQVFGWEVDALFLTAVLTVIGYSVHDTIVVFDRVRENRIIYPRADFPEVVNHSVVQTLDRSINTQLSTAFTLLALALFGGDTIRPFVVVLLVGVLSGTYSSVFIAAPLLVEWDVRGWGNRLSGRQRTAS